MFSRRSILFGLLAAPVVVRAGLIMPVRPVAHEMTATEAMSRRERYWAELVAAWERHQDALMMAAVDVPRFPNIPLDAPT